MKHVNKYQTTQNTKEKHIEKTHRKNHRSNQSITPGHHIQGAAEIVEHFKILIRCFSARVLWSAGV
jgi:hypothetical protein